MAFFFKKLITQLALPPSSLLLLAMLGLILAKRRPRLGLALTWSSLLLILVFAMPATASFLMRSLDVPPAEIAKNDSAQAIVVLGGGLRWNTPEYGDTLSQHTLDRVRYGATLARKTHLPILVSGGSVFVPPSEASVMAAVLSNDFGLTVRWIESESRDTGDNIKMSTAILKAEGIHTVILVTQDFHMRRALTHCRFEGLNCIAAPVSFAGRSSAGPWIAHLPNAAALQASVLALHEIFGNLALVFKSS